jgi:hypothetical protein
MYGLVDVSKLTHLSSELLSGFVMQVYIENRIDDVEPVSEGNGLPSVATTITMPRRGRYNRGEGNVLK